MKSDRHRGRIAWRAARAAAFTVLAQLAGAALQTNDVDDRGLIHIVDRYSGFDVPEFTGG